MGLIKFFLALFAVAVVVFFVIQNPELAKQVWTELWDVGVWAIKIVLDVIKDLFIQLTTQ